MQTITPVRDVRDAQIFRGSQQVFHAARHQRSHRNLKRQTADIDVIFTARRGVQIDAIAAHAYRVLEVRGRDIVDGLADLLAARIGSNLLLEDSKLGAEAPRFADVRK